MQNGGGKENRPRDPEAGAVKDRPQELAVAVHGLGAQVHLQVPDQVADDETEQDGAGDRHDDLAADGGTHERGGRKRRPGSFSRCNGGHCGDYMQARPSPNPVGNSGAGAALEKIWWAGA